MEGWRQWRLGRGYVCKKREKNFLTPTGLLMEGDLTTLRFLFAKNRGFECYRHVSTTTVPLGYNSRLRLSTVTGFDEAFAAVNHRKEGEPVSPELQPLLRRVYSDVLATTVDLAALKCSLIALLEYLTYHGRTNANCWAVDLFFCTSDGWERDWTEQNLPDEFHDVLSLMGQALHDTIGAPNIAQNFDCLPEQLLDRVRHLHLPTPVDE